MIVFHNDGLIDIAAATTFGINVKEGDTPIGFFGTGLKYAIAVVLRHGGEFRLFRGKIEYEFYVKDEEVRGEIFSIIHMRKRNSWKMPWQDQALGFTTKLGKHWEPWMALRELWSNTKDEDGNSFICDDEFYKNHVIGDIIKDERTVIVVNCPEMDEAFQNETIYLPPEKKLLASTSLFNIYEGASNYVFYRGLRVTDLPKPSLFTYDFTLGITLTEDRTSKYATSDQYHIMSGLMGLSGEETHLLETILETEGEDHMEATLPWDQPIFTPVNYGALVSFRYNSNLHLPKRMKAYHEQMMKEDEVDPYFDVKLNREEIETLITALGGGDDKLEAKLKGAMSDDPF